MDALMLAMLRDLQMLFCQCMDDLLVLEMAWFILLQGYMWRIVESIAVIVRVCDIVAIIVRILHSHKTISTNHFI